MSHVIVWNCWQDSKNFRSEFSVALNIVVQNIVINVTYDYPRSVPDFMSNNDVRLYILIIDIAIMITFNMHYHRLGQRPP